MTVPVPVPAAVPFPVGTVIRHRGDERGAVTAEAAMVLPVLVAVAVGLVWLVALAAAQVRIVDSAREVARVVARGDTESEAVRLGRQVAPDRARFSVHHDDRRVKVSAAASVAGPGGLFGFLPSVRVHSVAVASMEPQ